MDAVISAVVIIALRVFTEDTVNFLHFSGGENGGLRILEDDSHSMKKTLFFWKPVYRDLRWVVNGLKAFWMVSVKLYFSPTERNLLVSFWYDYQHFRTVQPDKSMDEYLDSRVQGIKWHMADMTRSLKSRQLYGNLMQALQNKGIRSMFVAYLDSASPKEDYPRMTAAIRGAWRMEDAREVTEGNEPVIDVGNEPVIDEGNEPGIDVGNEPVIDVGNEPGIEASNDGRADEANDAEEDAANEVVVNVEIEPFESKEPSLHAKAYVIAAQLDHELTDKATDFEVLSRDLPELMKFVQERFGVKKLPGTFEKFKGYSYRLILNDRNGAKKGQLQKPFRQIRDHPEIFGEAVAEGAGKILHQYFR
jgi:hypothetical protein